ncbi:hypothetical protein FO519_005115 [Halicephalobus sp. NKZ332]|nr:hypothetical protein FO519_005115 [Halicephalobus sp. NKZ332]
MSNLAWLAISWTLVAAVCYFIVFKLGRQASVEGQENQGGHDGAIGKPVNAFVNHLGNRANESGEERASTLINTVVRWLHANIHMDKKFSQFHSELIAALNDAAKRLLHEEPYDLKFDQNPESVQIDPPEVTNFKLMNGPTNQISARAHIFVKNATFKLVTSKRRNDKFVVNNYEALLSNIDADIDIRIALIADRPHAIICFVEAPTSQIILYDNEIGRVTDSEALELHDIFTKSAGASILNFKLDSAFETHKEQDFGENAVNDVVRKLYQSNDITEHSRSSGAPNRLHVNVLRAYDLKIKDVNERPFVVIEMDEPQRKYMTAMSQGKNPNWNENFDFDLSNGSDEILFEIYNPSSPDKNAENSFVGLAIVGIQELIKTKNPVQYLKLQGRPYHNDDVNGTLLVQFDFSADSKAARVGTHTRQVRLINENGEHLSETTINSVKPLGSGMGSLKDIDHLEPISTKTTTVTVKGVHKIDEKLQNQGDLAPYDPHDPHNPHDLQSPYDPFFRDNQLRRQQSDEHSQSTIVHRIVHPSQSAHFKDEINHDQYNYDKRQYEMHQDLSPRLSDTRRSGSEKRKRERSFFGDLKERLNRKRRQYGRSKSADPASSSLMETVSCPPSRDQSQAPCGREYDDHARYTGDENSKCTLVLELQQGLENKYFLIPPSIAREPAAAEILKKGKKLHLCKNHTFVAVKSAGGIVCNTCGGRIATGFNKQAYQCRGK